MRFLADENIPLPAIRLLREEGIDLEAITEFAASASDEEVLAHAKRNGQVLVTFDRDFGELIYRRGNPVPSGVVYLRILPASHEEVARIFLDLIALKEIKLAGHFTVVDRDRVRQRPLLEVL